MTRFKISYIQLMATLSDEGGTAFLTINDGTDDLEVLIVELDSRGVLCYQHGSELEELPITLDILFGADCWFEVEV